MSAIFPSTDNTDFQKAIHHKKEIISASVKHKKRDEVDNFIKENNILQLKEHQILAKRFFNPHTHYDRLLLFLLTGGGKTLTSLNIAVEFNKIFKREKQLNPDKKVGNIFIIGFTENIFKNELITRPELGFVSHVEVERLKKLRSMSGLNQENKDKYSDYRSYLKRRLSMEIYGGFFKFIGYKKLVNLLFKNPRLVSDMTNEEIEKNIGTKLKIDNDFVNLFNNSIMICDEIHNVYNSLEINNYGSALKYILNNTNIRALFLSATPMTNKPREINDLLQLLSKKEFDKKKMFSRTKVKAINQKFAKTDYIEQLTQYGKETINNLVRGKVSYLFKKSEFLFPKEILVGVPLDSRVDISFTLVPMSPEHKKVMNDKENLKLIEKNMNDEINDKLDKKDLNEVNNGELDNNDEISNTDLNNDDLNDKLDKDDFSKKRKDSRYLNDFIFPTKEGYGYSNADFSLITPEVKKKYGIEISNEGVLYGKFLDKLSIYSRKYEYMLKDIFSILKGTDNGKILIYHRYVKMSGALFIREILLHYGFIEFGSTPADNTISAEYGITKKEFDKKYPKKEFIPARFITIHSYISPEQIAKYLDLFNSPSNNYGDLIKIVVGSNKIKEALDFKAIKHLMVTHIPDNIPMYQQVKGRGIRSGSHLLLPPKDRNIKLYTYVYKNSPEEDRYKRKIKDYLLIEDISNMLKDNAIDKGLYHSDGKINIPINTIDKRSFNIFNYKEEIEQIVIIIKRLFLYQNGWEYDKLWSMVKNPPFTVYVNPNLFEQRNFNIALNSLVFKENEFYKTDKELHEYYLLLDPTMKIIYKNKNPMTVVHTGKYYTLVPYNIKEMSASYDYNFVSHRKDKLIDIKYYLENKSYKQNYDIKKEKLLKQFNKKIENFDKLTCSYGLKFQIRLLEDVITYMVHLLIFQKYDKKYNKFYYYLWKYYNNIGYIISAKNSNQLCSNYKKYVSLTAKPTIKLDTEENFIKTTKNLSPLKNKSNIVRSDMLPIGHFLYTVPRIYDLSDGWYDSYDYDYNNNQKFKENDIIVGYYEKSGTDLKFKLRPPIHKIKQSESYKKEAKGIVCSFNDKLELEKIAKSLNLKCDKEDTKKQICNTIKEELLRREDKEICCSVGERVKWFYRHFETQSK